ncbi:hypothetical protein Lser_V15G27707 [Lactuca serriola]
MSLGEDSDGHVDEKYRKGLDAVIRKTTTHELMLITFHSLSLQLCRLHAKKHVIYQSFLVYGQEQQRKAAIEVVHLSESGKKIQIFESDDKLCEEFNVTKSCPKDFIEKSKKWMQFVPQDKASGKSFEDCQKSGNATGVR